MGQEREVKDDEPTHDQAEKLQGCLQNLSDVKDVMTLLCPKWGGAFES